MAPNVRRGRLLRASTTLALVVAIILTFAQVATAQEAGSDPFSAGGLSESILAPDGSASTAGATIASDLPEYGPGSIVTLTGSGWQPGESVRIVVNDDGLQEQPWQRDVTVVAGADGTIGDIFELPMWFVANYTVTATGEHSGVATTSFTDATLPRRGCDLPIPNPGGPIVVDTEIDERNGATNPANGAQGNCSLREAIEAANLDPAPDTIQLPAGTYTLTRTGAGEDGNTSGDLDVHQPLTINGAGARSTIVEAGTTASNGIDRVLHISSSGSLTLSGATVRHGRILDDDGGGIHSSRPLTLTDVAVVDNSAGASGSARSGGGIYSAGGTLTITRATISGNRANPGASAHGGGIHTAIGGTLTNVTVTNNVAGDQGGGVRIIGGTATLTNVTVSHNTAATGAGIRRDSGTIILRNTIVSTNGTSNCSGAVGNSSNNLDSGTTCGFTTANASKSNANADLGALQNNGGPTDTRRLGASSAATDAGTATSAPQNDQRSVPRPQAAAHDIGAFELSSVTLTKVNGSVVTFPYTTNQDVTSVGGACVDGLGPVSVTLGGNAPDPATASCSGDTWTLTLATALSDDGDNTFAASQLGAAGSGDKVVTIDKTAPTVTLDQVNGATRTFPYFTNQNVTSVDGSCTTGDGPVSVTLDGSATDPATASCSAGSWELTLTAALSAEDSYTFAASQTDAAGNTGGSGDKVIQIDTTPPTLTASAVKGTAPAFDDEAPYDEDSWTNQDVKVSFVCSDNEGGSGVADGSPDPASETFNTEGEHTASSACADNAGNSTDTDFGVKIDTTPPTISVLDVTPASPNGDNGWYRTAVTVRFQAEDEASGLDDACEAAFPEDEGINVQSKTTSTQGDAVTVESDNCTDVAGNTAPKKTSAAFKIDTEKPEIEITHTADGDGGWNVTDPVEVSVAVSDATSGVAGAPNCEVDGNPAVVSGTASPYTLSVSGEGVHDVDCSVDDNAGWSESDTDEVKIDTQKPSSKATSDDYENTSTFEVTYTRSDDASGVAKVELWVKGPGATEYTLDSTDVAGVGNGIDGSFMFTAPTEGTYRFYTIAYDEAGNVEAAPIDQDTNTIVEDDETLYDATPPQTTAGATGYNFGDWTNQDVSVTLTAIDYLGLDIGGAGVDKTYYRVGSTGDFSEYTAAIPLSAEGEHTIFFKSTDKAGNAEAETSVTVKIDKTAPTIFDEGATSSPNGNGWYAAPVTNKFEATDGGSGLDAACVAAFPGDGAGDHLQTKTTSGGGNAVTVDSDGCSDVAGNPALPKTSAPFKIDLTDPSVAITSPADGSSTSSSSVTVSGSASDTPSGLASVTVNGSPVTVNGDGTWSTTVNPECGPAPYTITAIAMDNAGRDKVHAIDITRNCAQGPAGLHARFLTPLDESVKSTTRIANKAKSGRVVPVQIELYSGQTRLTSAEIAEGDVTIQVTKMATCDPNATETLETYAAAGSANTGSIFRWSGTKMIFNLDTGNRAYAFAVNGCYRLNVLYKETLISWAPAPTAPATNISTAADWWAYLQIVR